MDQQPVYYGDYLQLEKIIESQDPESWKEGRAPAHDEMLFIIIHQAYELWFKQILFEVESVVSIMGKPSLNDNSNELQTVVHRLQRVVTILRVLVQQMDIMETMTPMDFLDFRDMLRPASGFQSWQFKIIEARLGLKFDQRHGKDYYISQLRQKEIDLIKSAEEKPSVLTTINSWLERMPFLTESEDGNNKIEAVHPFWKSYESIYQSSLSEMEKNNLEAFRHVFFGAGDSASRGLSPKACQSALFIMLYRGYPMLELPFTLLETLLEIDNQMGNWRYRHINMVRRTIGSRVGTGGSTGAGYLMGAMEKHYIFREISQLTSFLIERSKLPILPASVRDRLGYQF